MSSDRAGAVLSLSNSDVQAYCDVQAVKLLGNFIPCCCDLLG